MGRLWKDRSRNFSPKKYVGGKNGKENFYAVVAENGSLFAGPASADFRSATDAWMKTFGDLPAAG
jgi:hypothetical protein